MTDDTQNPRMTDDTQNPRMTDDTHNPRMTDDTQNPRMTDDTHNPRMTDDTHRSTTEAPRTDERVTGIVVAGGRSRRFGDREKALACVDGEPQLHRVVRSLESVCARVLVNCRDAQVDSFAETLGVASEHQTEHAGGGGQLLVSPGRSRMQFVVDDVPDGGPVAGLERALAATETQTALVVGCDFPFLGPSVLRELHCHRRRTGAEAVVARGVSGRVQPLVGAYRVDPARAACAAARERGSRSLTAVLDDLDTRTVETAAIPGADAALSLFNVNTRADLRCANRLAARRHR